MVYKKYLAKEVALEKILKPFLWKSIDSEPTLKKVLDCKLTLYLTIKSQTKLHGTESWKKELIL